MKNEGSDIKFNSRRVTREALVTQDPLLNLHAPVVDFFSFRPLLGHAAREDLEIRCRDVKTALLTAHHHKLFWMRPSAGYRTPGRFDPCLFIGCRDGRRRSLILYVDNFLSAERDEVVDVVMDEIKQVFEVDDGGELNPGKRLGMVFTRH